MSPPPPIDTAMILAAGKGLRMRPLTNRRPKPLVEVAGRTLIDRILDHLEAVGIGRIVVNVHHLAGMLTEHLRSRSGDILISDERGALLETGGGVRKALPLLGHQPFLAINADALWLDPPTGPGTLSRMIEAWSPERMDVLLLMVPTATLPGYEGRGDFHMAADGRLSRRAPDEKAAYLYGGVQILSPALFDGIGDEVFSLNRIYDMAAATGRLYGLPMAGDWLHVGTPEAVTFAAGFLDAREKP